MKKVLPLAAIIVFSAVAFSSCKSRKGDKCPAYSQAQYNSSAEVAEMPEK